MELQTLEQRAKELKQRLSELGQMVHNGKYWLTLRYNGLNIRKRQLYELEQERLQFDDIWNYRNLKIRNNAIKITNLKRDIELSRERLKDEEKNQRELIYEIKKVNREYSKLERRLAKKVNANVKPIQ